MLGRTNFGGGSNKVINGIIEQYLAESETIDANTFVEFINGMTVKNNDQLSSVDSSYEHASAVLIDENKIFVAHRNGSYLYAMICTLSENSIVLGTDVKLTTTTDSYLYYSIVLVDTNKVFLAYRNSSYLYARICSIVNNTITLETPIQLSTDNLSYEYVSAVLIDESRIFVAHRHGGSSGYNYYNRLYGMICSINGVVITKGTDVELSNYSNDSYKYTSTILIDNNKVLVPHQEGNDLIGTFCSISPENGITIDKKETLVSVTSCSEYYNAILLDKNKIFINYKNGNYLYGVIFTIKNDELNFGLHFQLSNIMSSYQYAKSLLIDKNKVFIVCGGNQNSSSFADYLSGIICNISQMEITINNDTFFSNDYRSRDYSFPLLLNKNNIFIVYRGGGNTNATSKFLYGMIVSIEERIRKSITKIDGLTKGKITTTSKGNIWCLKESEEI